MRINKNMVLQLYRSLMRSAKDFPSSNKREWMFHTIRSDFGENRTLVDASEIEFHYKVGLMQLKNIAAHVTTLKEAAAGTIPKRLSEE